MMQMFTCDEDSLQQHLPPHLAGFISSRRPDVVGGSSLGIKSENPERHPEEDDDDLDPDF